MTKTTKSAGNAVRKRKKADPSSSKEMRSLSKQARRFHKQLVIAANCFSMDAYYFGLIISRVQEKLTREELGAWCKATLNLEPSQCEPYVKLCAAYDDLSYAQDWANGIDHPADFQESEGDTGDDHADVQLCANDNNTGRDDPTRVHVEALVRLVEEWRAAMAEKLIVEGNGGGQP
jgi:hypothetical protein